MRKFRGIVKDIDTPKKRWAYGYYCQVQGKHYIIFDDAEYDNCGLSNENYQPVISGLVEVIPETVGQFTGRLDKNGKKIYEGDIYTCKIGGDSQANPFVVEDLRSFYRGLDCSDGYLRVDERSLEVIGNIHENPELLEAK